MRPRWYDARYCPGVARLVGAHDGRPATIGDSVIEAIKAREKRGLVELPPPPRLFGPGSRVIVTSGLFSGRTGVVALHRGLNGKERVCVLLGTLKIEVMREAVEVIGQ